MASAQVLAQPVTDIIRRHWRIRFCRWSSDPEGPPFSAAIPADTAQVPGSDKPLLFGTERRFRCWTNPVPHQSACPEVFGDQYVHALSGYTGIPIGQVRHGVWCTRRRSQREIRRSARQVAPWRSSAEARRSG